jgi:hypothetical protein
VLPIQPGCGAQGDKELRAIGVGACIGHGQLTLLGVLQIEILQKKKNSVVAGGTSGNRWLTSSANVRP